MATKHRRAFSLKPETAVRLYIWARTGDSTPTGKIEEVLNEKMDLAGVPRFDRKIAQQMISVWIEHRNRRKEIEEVEEHHGQHFTF